MAISRRDWPQIYYWKQYVLHFMIRLDINCYELSFFGNDCDKHFHKHFHKNIFHINFFWIYVFLNLKYFFEELKHWKSSESDLDLEMRRRREQSKLWERRRVGEERRRVPSRGIALTRSLSSPLLCCCVQNVLHLRQVLAQISRS